MSLQNLTRTVSFQILQDERHEECDVEHLESEPALQCEGPVQAGEGWRQD